MNDDYYKILGVPPSASQADIKSRFRFLSQAYHPDKFGTDGHKKDAEEEFKRINSAYQVLSNPSERSRYDASRTQSSTRAGYQRSASEPPPRRPEPERRPPQPKPDAPPKASRANEHVSEDELGFWGGVGAICGLVLLYAVMYLQSVLSK